jgi:hypothetical protein
MKILYIILLTFSSLFSQTIDEKIQKLEEATPQKRVELMNQIKEQLVLMNQHERMNTIHLLKAQFHNENRLENDSSHQVSSENHLNEEQQEVHENQLHQHHRILENQNRHQDLQEIEEPYHDEVEQ